MWGVGMVCTMFEDKDKTWIHSYDSSGRWLYRVCMYSPWVDAAFLSLGSVPLRCDSNP